MINDEYIIKNGKEGFLRQIKDALNIMEFKELELKGEYNLNNTKQYTYGRTKTKHQPFA